MTSRERKLRIENHPDKWGGDHSRMEKVFEVVKRTSSMAVRRVCKVCGVRVNRAEYCALHYRAAHRKLVDVRAFAMASMLALVLMAASSFAQRGTLTPKVVEAAPTVSILAIPQVVVAPFKQAVLTWDNPAGASNRVAWGTVRDAWTNGVRVITTNAFFVTNGWSYKVTAIVNGIESIPALWPSNRFDRVIVQTSTNLLTWQDAFTWQTNFNKPQEYLRLRSELIGWE